MRRSLRDTDTAEAHPFRIALSTSTGCVCLTCTRTQGDKLLHNVCPREPCHSSMLVAQHEPHSPKPAGQQRGAHCRLP